MFRKSRGLWDALFFYIHTYTVHAPTKLCRKSADLSDPPMHRDPGLRIGGSMVQLRSGGVKPAICNGGAGGHFLRHSTAHLCISQDQRLFARSICDKVLLFLPMDDSSQSASGTQSHLTQIKEASKAGRPVQVRDKLLARKDQLCFSGTPRSPGGRDGLESALSRGVGTNCEPETSLAGWRPRLTPS
jgi:hypothetical protein